MRINSSLFNNFHLIWEETHILFVSIVMDVGKLYLGTSLVIPPYGLSLVLVYIMKSPTEYLWDKFSIHGINFLEYVQEISWWFLFMFCNFVDMLT
jgi:hypothetical protein